MAFKDLTEFLQPDLQIELGGKTYSVKPPTRDVGLRLSAIVALGVATFDAANDRCPTCGRSGRPDIPQDTRDLVDSMKDTNLADLALGPEVAAQMNADGIPEMHQDTAAQYAMYYWVLGEATADQVMASSLGSAAEVQAPKA